MGIDLNTLKENELRTFSYAETRLVITELEKIRLPSLDGIDAIERVETLYSFVTLIKNRVVNHEFAELGVSGKKSEIKNLHMTLDLLLSTFKFSLDVNKLQKRMAEVDSERDALDARFEDIRNKLQTTVSDYNAKKEELEGKVEFVEQTVVDFQKKVDETEHTMLTHVLTLMGVFTAVITIIMSLVITSGAWINSADAATALVAVAVPNLVAVFVVVVLLSLVFLYHKGITKGVDEPKGVRVFFGSTFAVVVILSVVMAWFAITTHSNKAVRVQHIISPSEYSITEEVDCETGKKVIYYEFMFDGAKYQFLYDEQYSHDGNLYFCEETETLE